MTIKVKVGGTFVLVLALVAALGANALLAGWRVKSELAHVVVHLDKNEIVSDYDNNARILVAWILQYAAEENPEALAKIEASLSFLTKPFVLPADRKHPTDSGDTARLPLSIAELVEAGRRLVDVVKIRFREAGVLDRSLTALESAAIDIDRLVDDRLELSAQGAIFLSNAQAAGISALRYRFSRNAADVTEAKRKFAAASAAARILIEASPRDDTWQKALAVAPDVMRTFEQNLTRYEAATFAVGATTAAFKNVADVVLALSAEVTADSVQEQREAVVGTQNALNGARTFSIFATALGILACIGLAVLLVRLVALPIVSITQAVRKIVAGSLETRIPEVGRRDEVGDMAAAVASFQDSLKRVLFLDEEKESERVGRSRRMTRIESLNVAFESQVGLRTATISGTASNLAVAAQALMTVASETNKQSAMVKSAADAASRSFQDVVSVSRSVTNSIENVGRQVLQSTRAAEHVATKAREADAGIGALLEGAHDVRRVIQLIRSISTEIDILALNAAIEASRAGTVGSGFAAVAGEVKKLAVAVGEAANDVIPRIDAIQAMMKEAVATFRGIQDEILGVQQSTLSITDAVGRQSSSVNAIRSEASAAAEHASRIIVEIGSVQAGSSTTDEAARKVLDAARTVTEQANDMLSEVGSFLDDVKAA